MFRRNLSAIRANPCRLSKYKNPNREFKYLSEYLILLTTQAVLDKRDVRFTYVVLRRRVLGISYVNPGKKDGRFQV